MDDRYLFDFVCIRPDLIVEQQQAIAWIAKMHVEAERKQGTINPEQLLLLEEQINRLFEKIGLGKEKIQTRGMHLSDLRTQDLDKMLVYNINKTSKGVGLKEKMDIFSKETLTVFDKIYNEKQLPRHLIHVTCTGYVSPSPAQKIVSRRKSENTSVTHSYHMGCYGAFPALRIAKGHETSDIVHTEFCTLHMNPLNHTLGQLVVESLFADGFIKYTVSGSKELDIPCLKICSLHEIIIPDSEDSMTWQCEDWGFGMFLSKDVPLRIATSLPDYVDSLIKEAGLSSKEIYQRGIFAIHPGGPKIIGQVQEKLRLEYWQVAHSKQILLTHGNMSSATLPHIWDTILQDVSVPNGSYIVSMAFGPGLTISGSIFQKIG
ncbi:MAG: naringenin-chalcone synthase [Alphaproteobacteria bacterium]|nr:naringenin-chalcone synthase [Alphaproteobacteria bacterium]